MPSPSTYKVTSPPLGLPLSDTVDTLINVAEGTWKTDLIQHLFLPHEVDIIQGVALSTKLLEDKQVWAPTANGMFTVRSAYKIAMEMHLGSNSRTVSDDSNLRKFWKCIWQVNVPHKIYHFT